MRSRFGKHLVFWLILPIVLVFAAPAVPDLGLFRLSEAERIANRQALGNAYEEVEARAEGQFRQWCVESGLVRWSFDTFARSGPQAFEVARESKAASEYLTRLWLTVHKAFYRFEVALHWFAATSVLVVAFFIDGVVRRRIKSFEFGYSNPVAFHLSGHGLLAVLGLLLVAPILPFAIQQWTWPLLIGFAGLIAWKTAESYQTSL